jgi:hypothetical protein
LSESVREQTADSRRVTAIDGLAPFETGIGSRGNSSDGQDDGQGTTGQDPEAGPRSRPHRRNPLRQT